MNPIRAAIARLLRSAWVSRRLRSFGIDPRRYWLLVDLFGELGDRGEMADQLGWNGAALTVVAKLYAVLFGILSLIVAAGGPPLSMYAFGSLAVSTSLLLVVLLSEAGNSLVNPAESLVLAHQPVNGATYIAAKLTHLVRVVLYMATAMNAGPAFAGLLLKESGWWYPLVHLLAAILSGFVAALLCCALYGWLIRFLPAARLRAAGQFAATIPFLLIVFSGYVIELVGRLDLLRWLPARPSTRWAVAAACGAFVIGIVILGIRSLSADYLVRVSSLMHAGSAAGAKARRSRIGEAVARFFGGPAARAGFSFVSRLMLRDWQFRRQFLFAAIGIVLLGVQIFATGWRTDPFSRQFSTVHLLPHLLGALLFMICILLPHTNDHKGVWIFLLAPPRVFGCFARGVHALLWIEIIVIPHIGLLLLFVWVWGIGKAALFIAYSVAAASVYLAIELRVMNGLPFSKPVNPSTGAAMLPMMIVGGIAMGVVVALQYFFLFRSPAIVALAAAVTGATAWFLTRRNLVAFENSIHHELGLISAEVPSMFKEVG